MWVLVAIVVVALVGIPAALLYSRNGVEHHEPPPWVLSALAGSHVGIMGGLAGFAVTGIVLIVGLARGQSASATTPLSTVVIMMLGEQPRRFNELKRMIGGISQRMLTLTLRGLERDGLITRTVFPTIPPRVDYELTDLGRGLWKPVEALGAWAQAHQAEIETARAKFDARND